MSFSVVVIGAGNLATHLAKVLSEKGYLIRQVYSRSESSAKALSDSVNSGWVTNTAEIIKDADIYFIALKDDVTAQVIAEVGFSNQLLIHCSGSLPASVLSGFSPNFGVFYPLQTFSKQREVNFSEIPVFIEASTPEAEKIISEIARSVSDTVVTANSEQRMKLHISAVFACNFVNHLYCIAAKLLVDNQLEFGWLKPLIAETSRKIESIHPMAAQTGPAVRFDSKIIQTHLSFLKENPMLFELYDKISQSIFTFHQK